MNTIMRLGFQISTNSSRIACGHELSRIGKTNFNQFRQAGHAKWQNIKNTKQANDLAKGKLISRYVQLIRRAVISNGRQTDPKLNPKLAELLTEGGRLNVPKATMERAIARAVDLKIKSINLEIQGPAGSTLIARCETENIPTLRRDVKKILKKHDANLLSEDTVINMFRSQGYIRCSTITVDGCEINEDFAEEAAIIANAEEVALETNDGAQDESLANMWVFVTDAQNLNPCKGELEKQKFKVISCDLDLVAYRDVDFGPEVYEKIIDIQKSLRELEQVIDVFHNVSQPKSS